MDRDYAVDHEEVRPGQYVLIAITDDGVGMSAETLSRAFEPFFTTKEPGRGTGLGLSMVYGFVKQSGGHVKLYSEPGEGTIAKVYLPRSLGRDLSDEPVSTREGRLRGSGQLILVVEDDPNVRALTTRLIERLGYRAIVAAEAASALELIEAEPDIALLFTDVVLPGGRNGAELAREAQRLRPHLPVLYTSGYTENAIIHHGRLDPGVRLLEKPFRGEELARCLRDALYPDGDG
jgi:CheY-like chemotaxis protein